MASLTPKPDANEDESFIILGTSPGTSLDLKCNGIDTPSLDRVALDDAMKDLPEEASSAFKAHFKLNEGPSPASLMVASTLITDDKSTEELQKQFGDLLDENVILKETLKKNNESMKEQFLMIASCQEDMMKTHMIHKEKFDETRELVEKLRQENKKLKADIARLAESETQKSSEVSSGPPSALEFVTSPDDDTINKLTAQLELVEKQRRQVIVENEKLTWQKESLEHIVDATSKERDDLKEKLKKLEMQQSSIESDYIHKINLQNNTILDLNTKLETATNSMSILSTGELTKRDEIIRQLETKVIALQTDLKHAQLKILDAENVKLEFSKYKSGVTDTVKIFKDQIQDLQNRLKEAQTIVFQPVRFSISSEPDNTGSSEYASFMSNVKLYDKTLKHIAEMLNLFTHGSVDSLVECLGVVSSLHDFKLERSNADQVRASLTDLKQSLEKQHNTALSNIGQVRGTLSIFEGIFKDYNELLKKSSNTPAVTQPTPPPQNVNQLTAALVARGQELQTLKSEIAALKSNKEDTDILKAQLDLYKSDFEAERESREQMASEKENILADLRTTQKRNQELLLQLEEVRKLNPTIFRNATAKRPQPSSPARGQGSQGSTASQGQSQGQTGSRRQSAPGTTTGNMVKKQKVGDDDRENTPPPLGFDCPVCDQPFKTVYTCPKCMRFSSDQYKVMEDHFDFCLDDF